MLGVRVYNGREDEGIFLGKNYIMKLKISSRNLLATPVVFFVVVVVVAKEQRDKANFR